MISNGSHNSTIKFISSSPFPRFPMNYKNYSKFTRTNFFTWETINLWAILTHQRKKPPGSAIIIYLEVQLAHKSLNTSSLHFGWPQMVLISVAKCIFELSWIEVLLYNLKYLEIFVDMPVEVLKLPLFQGPKVMGRQVA